MAEGKDSSAWKWILGVGCGCLVLVVGGMALLGGAAWFGLSKVMEMQPMLDARAEAEANPDVTAKLGTPLVLKMGVMSGNEPHVHMQNDSGSNMVMQADGLELSGPDGQGTVNFEAEETAGGWTFRSLEVHLDGETIDLVNDGYEPGG